MRIALVLLTLSMRLHSVWPLSCITCSDLSCNVAIPTTCNNGETMCITATILTNSLLLPNGSSTSKIRRCAPSSICQSTGDMDISLDTGSADILARASCCNSDNCNTNSVPIPPTPASALLTCFSCDSTSHACTSSGVTCNTLESNCFTSSGIPATGSGAVPIHGCASQSFCAIAPTLSMFPLLNSVVTVQGTPTCCSGNNCNVLPTTTDPPTTTDLPAVTTSSTGAPSSSVASLLMLQVFALIAAHL